MATKNIHFFDLEVEELLSHTLIFILFYQLQFNIVEAGLGPENNANSHREV